MFRLILEGEVFEFENRDKAYRHFRKVARNAGEKEGAYNQVACHIKMASPEAVEMTLVGFVK